MPDCANLKAQLEAYEMFGRTGMPFDFHHM